MRANGVTQEVYLIFRDSVAIANRLLYMGLEAKIKAIIPINKHLLIRNVLAYKQTSFDDTKAICGLWFDTIQDYSQALSILTNDDDDLANQLDMLIGEYFGFGCGPLEMDFQIKYEFERDPRLLSS